MKLSVGSDERTHLTDWVVKRLEEKGEEVVLHGALKPEEATDWPLVAQKVAEEVASGSCEQGILFCWTGTGVSMAANKVPGVRAALCADGETARGARRWNDANLLCMSLRLTSPQVRRGDTPRLELYQRYRRDGEGQHKPGQADGRKL